MTFAMSTESDSVKSGLSEANDKNVTDNHTDESSQDSLDVKQASGDNKPIENNVNSEKEAKPNEAASTEGESEHESESSEKKLDEEVNNDDAKMEVDEAKAESKTDEVKEEENKTKDEEIEGDEQKDDSNVDDQPEKDDKEAKEKDEKASTASEREEEEEEEEDKEGDEVKSEKSNDKKSVPLLDQPLETSSKRERKNVEKFEETSTKKTDQPKLELYDGSGTALGEIPRVEASITRFKNDDLKFLHRLLFGAQGKNTLFKKNIRKFSGFGFEKDSDEYGKKAETLRKSDVKVLKTTCEILDLQKNGTKEELVERIMEFLVEPKDSGKPLGGTGRPKRASAVRANNRGYSSHDDYSSDERHASRARRDKGKRANLKDESSSDEEFKPGDVSDGSSDKPRSVGRRKRGRTKKGSSDEDEASLSGVTSDESDDVPKSKRRKSITKSNSRAKRGPGRRGRPAKNAGSASRSSNRGRRGRKPKDVSSDDEDEDDKIDEGSSSEDEPLVKKKKSNEPPTDDEIKCFIKTVLEGANLEEITMKTVCQRVYDNYPDFDLTTRKNFIKSTVKSLIST